MKLIISALLALLTFGRQTTPALEYDICIYGATSAGVMAAYSAAQMGKKVILIDPKSHIGGLTSGGLGYTDIGNKYAIKGLSLDFYRRVGTHYGKFEQWIFEPHVADSLFRDYLKRGEVEVLLNHRLKGATMQGTQIKQIDLDDTQARQTKKLTAHVFIDCTYEGDLMAAAEVSYFIGREANDTYNETYNGVQLMTGHQFPDGVDPYKVKGDSTSGLLWGISDHKLSPTGSGDKKVQAYNYRMCLTKIESNKIPITRPQDYDPSRYELFIRLIEAQPNKTRLNDYFIVSSMPNGKTDINNRGGFSSDMIGMNYEYPEGDFEKRESIIREHENYTKGLLYFILTDSRIPPAMKNDLQQLGYPKDEYRSNNNWTPQLYIREARRMIGEYVMTQANCELRENVNDGIAMAAYTMDSHNCDRLVVNGMVKNEGNVEVGGGKPYPISYRAIIPKKSECTNLLVPVCLSASHIAYGSIRMEPVFMALAQSAAIAASIAHTKNVAVQEVQYSDIKKLLRDKPLLDNSVADIVIDNDDEGIIQTGKWNLVASGGYGPSFLLSDSANNEVPSVTFQAKVLTGGKYDLYTYINIGNKTSPEKTYEITGKAFKQSVKLKMSDVVFEGQTTGGWVKLGSFNIPVGLASIRVFDQQRRPVIADAVQLVHQGDRR